jgi:hypothetical protein
MRDSPDVLTASESDAFSELSALEAIPRSVVSAIVVNVSATLSELNISIP